MLGKLFKRLQETFKMKRINEDWATQEFIDLADKLMPEEGPAKTVEGELVRALNKIIYRYYNDGDYFWSGYGIETAGAPYEFLLHMAKKYNIAGLKDLLEKGVSIKDEQYEKWLSMMEKIIIDYVKSKGENLTPNSFDMLDDIYHKSADDDFESYKDDEEE